MSKVVAASFLAGLVGLGCTHRSGLNYSGGSGGTRGGAIGGQAGGGTAGTPYGSGGASGGGGSGGVGAGGTGPASAAGAGGPYDALVAPGAAICDQFSQTLQSSLDGSGLLYCRVDSDCTIIYLGSLSCPARCGQPVDNYAVSRAAAIADSLCNQYSAAGCPEIAVDCAPRPSVGCDNGRCVYSAPSNIDSGAGGAGGVGSSGGASGTGGSGGSGARGTSPASAGGAGGFGRGRSRRRSRQRWSRSG